MHRHTMFFATLLIFLQYATAVTLNDFIPRLTDLTGACSTLYTADIADCSGKDFQGGECSSSCVSSLKSIGNAVRKSCQGQGDRGTIIAAFLDGQGAAKLCPNAADATTKATSSSSVTMGSGTTASSATIGSGTTVLSATSLNATGLIVDSTATIQPTAASSYTDSPINGVTSTITGTSLAFATSTPSSVLMATEATPSSSQPTSGSGGDGTPFDTSAACKANISPLTLLSGVLAAGLFLLCS